MSSCIHPYLTSCSYSELLNISVRSPGMQNLRVLKSRESGALWKGEVLALIAFVLLLCPYRNRSLLSASFAATRTPLTLHFPVPHILIFISYLCFWYLPLSLSPHFPISPCSLFHLCFLLLSLISLSFFLLILKDLQDLSVMFKDLPFLHFHLHPKQVI